MTLPDGLATPLLEVARHERGPLLVTGGAGTGKTTALAARFAWLVSQGIAPESILALCPTTVGADALRRRIEDGVAGPYEELAVESIHGCGLRLLREETEAAGLDPFFAAVGAADRLAVLLDHQDELELRQHDLGGRPAALLAGVIARIDRLKDEHVGADDYAAWAHSLPRDDDVQRARADREAEFARLYLDHDRLLAAQGALDAGDLVLRAIALLRERPDARARASARYRHVLVDDLGDLDHAHVLLVDLLAGDTDSLVAATDPDGATRRLRGAGAKNGEDFLRARPDAAVVTLDRSLRSPQRILDAAASIVARIPGRPPAGLSGPEGGTVRFWRAASERSQAQAVAAEIERLVRDGADPGRIAVLVRSVRREAREAALAFDERAIPFRIAGATDYLAQAEVRDVLAWLRVLADPTDAGAAVRVLARPPVGLRSVDIARCVQIARRRKLDMVSALIAATESPQLPPEARDHVLQFLDIHRAAAAELDTARPDLFLHRLIERLGLRRQQLFAAQADVVERLVGLARLGELAGAYARRAPEATPRDFTNYVAAVADVAVAEDALDPTAPRAGAVQVMALHAVGGREFDHVFVLGLTAARLPGGRLPAHEPIPDALLPEELPPDGPEAHEAAMRRLTYVALTRATEAVVLCYPERSSDGARRPPSPFAEEARAALGAEWEDVEEELFGPEEALHATFLILRDELLADVARVGKGLGELRLDTELDVTHAVARYLELVKLAALLERPPGQSIADALPAVNQRLGVALSPLQREVLASSELDALLMDAERDDRARAAARAARAEPSLQAFLPTRGEGLVLSASDVETYRICPLRYKFARVFRIPQEPTLNQRFGILVHQVLERYHQASSRTLDDLLGLLEGGWWRSGFGTSDEELQLRAKADAALRRYHQRCAEEPVEPVWFERAFSFALGAHTLRGRVDRVDRLAEGGYALVDYKTGRPRTAHELREDVQLSLYAVGAREAWQLDAVEQAYLYVLDDERVRVPTEAIDPAWITDTVNEVAEGILAQGFEPTPSYAACSTCDYRIACPAAER